MIEQIMMYMAGLPAFLSYFAIGGILILLYTSLYNMLTPMNEWELIKQADTAAAVAFAGSLLGFVVPLASAIENAQSNLDCVLWGVVALIVQLAAFFAVRVFMPTIAEKIRAGEMAAGILLASISLSVGMLTAASMTF